MSILLQLDDKPLELKNFNNDFLLLKSLDASSVAAIGKAIFEKKFDFVDEVIVTEVEICLKLNKNFEAAKVESLLDIGQQREAASTTYNFPVYFNEQDDWEQVELHTGFSKKEIISKLEQIEFSIAMFGFLPGFVYLNGLDKSLQVPRKKVPSKYVKANSIALGGKYLGLYSIDSPGGWYVIGHAPISILEIPNLPPVSINLGDKIKLQPIDKKTYDNLLDQQTTITSYNA